MSSNRLKYLLVHLKCHLGFSFLESTWRACPLQLKVGSSSLMPIHNNVKNILLFANYTFFKLSTRFKNNDR